MSKSIKRWLLSDLLCQASTTKRIAYIAVMSALCVICNMFFEFKLADTQFSLTIFFSAFTGVLLGAVFGFMAAFLGDLVGFLYNSGGFMYMPWIGLSMGLTATFAGLIMNAPIFKFKGAKYVKVALVCVATFLLCTIAINTTAFWIIYNTRKVPFWAYLVTRMFVQGQIWNSLVNYALLFVAVPLFDKITKLLKKQNGF